jgi:hypothetical protein
VKTLEDLRVYALLDRATGRVLATYDGKAPATALAYHRVKWGPHPEGASRPDHRDKVAIKAEAQRRYLTQECRLVPVETP